MNKEAKREYDRQYHAKRSKAAKKRKQRLQTERRRNIAKEVWNYLLKHPCIDCNEVDPIVLDFDHIRGVKVSAISNAVRHGWSLKRIFSEIKKCVVRCANCHRRRTAKQFNWFQGEV